MLSLLIVTKLSLYADCINSRRCVAGGATHVKLGRILYAPVSLRPSPSLLLGGEAHQTAKPKCVNASVGHLRRSSDYKTGPKRGNRKGRDPSLSWACHAPEVQTFLLMASHL